VIVNEHGDLTVADALGPLHPPRPSDGRAVPAVLRDLRVLAQASALLQATSAGSGLARRPYGEVDIVWGVVRHGVRHVLPRSGGAARVGEEVYIEVRNNGFRDLFVSLVDVGVTGGITVLTQEAPSGARVTPGRRYEFGGPLGWPEGLDPKTARPETVLVMVSASPHDISSLQQRRAGDPDRIAVVEDSGPEPTEGIDVYCVEFELEAVRQ
jgi:hypothetical protein